jgi:hypothetical protein
MLSRSQDRVFFKKDAAMRKIGRSRAGEQTGAKQWYLPLSVFFRQALWDTVFVSRFEFAQGQLEADPALLKAVARGKRWFKEIASAQVRSSAEIARGEALPKGYVAALMRLAFLSPTLVEAVVEGRGPAGISLQRLVNSRVALPLAWRDQEEWLIGQVGA